MSTVHILNNIPGSGWNNPNESLPQFGKYVLVLGTDNSMYGIENFHVCCMDDLEDGVEFSETGNFYWLTEAGRKIDNVRLWSDLPNIENV
jgi:hypothetical protein